MQILRKNKYFIWTAFLFFGFLLFQNWQINQISEKIDAIPKKDTTRIQLCEVKPLGKIVESDYHYIHQYNLNVNITKDFKGFEYVKFNDPEINIYKGDTFQIHKNIAAGLQIIRSHYGIPVVVNSPQRSPAKQALVNPSMKDPHRSDHVGGNAADWTFLFSFSEMCDRLIDDLKNETNLRLALVNGLKITQIIIYNGHIHFGFGDPNRGEIDCGGVFLEIIDKRKALIDHTE